MSGSDPHLPNPSNPKIHKTHEGEHHGDFGDIPIKLTRSTYLFALCAAVNSCNLGYDIGVSTEAGRLIQEDLELTRVQREIFIGSLNFWAMFGAFFAHYFTDKYGRRRTFLVASIHFIVGILIMVISQSYTLLLIGRLFVGLGVGVGLAIDPLYIAEVTPAKYRGELVTWSEIALNVGIVFGFATGLFLGGFSTSAEWRIMFLLGTFFPVLMMVLVCTVMPETPRWFAAHDRLEEAREVLRRIYPDGFDIEPVLQDMRDAIARDAAAERSVGWSMILCHPTRAFQRMLLVGVGTAVAQQAVGIDAIQYYLLDIIESTDIENSRHQSLVLVLLGIIKLVFIVIGGKCFDKRGRRPLFFVSLTGMTLALLVVGVAQLGGVGTGAQVGGLALYLASFSLGMGPGAWLIPSEIFSVTIRAKAMSLATTMNRATATLMASTFLSTAHAMGGFGAFFCLLGVVCVLVFAFLYFLLPETKGRSLEDMAVYFAEITGDSSVLEAEAELVQRRPLPSSAPQPQVQTAGEMI